jgi:hypothetical protein
LNSAFAKLILNNMQGHNVYEAVNMDKRESLVALCASTPDEFAERLRSAPPPEIRHWQPGDYYVEQIAKGMSRDDAEIFFGAFSGKLRGSDWRVIALNL